ncbi:uncharacterized protein LOC129601060 [Paramacrobiotus metropolitanus]|uniref:uncharacterized protein LOC129601060 n=1 Tax=Paramacrobiotus metropolitanus TaxID=2943436 RepID=UPI0024464018|nr:uncharacterized protein LOC129601060 [Paramacrobiotus metropolitanus]
MSTKRILMVRPENVATSSKGKITKTDQEPSSAYEPSTSQPVLIGKAYKRSKSDSSLSVQKKLKQMRKKDDASVSTALPFTIYEETETRKSASSSIVGEREAADADEQDENSNSLSDNVNIILEDEEQKPAVENRQELPYDVLKSIAEDRRLALETALMENQMLYAQLDSLTKENEVLAGMAAQADEMARILAADAYRSVGVDVGTQTEPFPVLPRT